MRGSVVQAIGRSEGCIISECVGSMEILGIPFHM